MTRGWPIGVLLCIATFISGCGGGGASGDSGNTPHVVVSAAGVVGGNVMPIVVDSGPAGGNSNSVNVPYVSVTICAPGTNVCQTVDHIIVDTGSTGLRFIASALDQSILNALPQRQINGVNLNECLNFVNSSIWGSIRTADIQLAQESKISSLAIQIIADPSYRTAPTSCTNLQKTVAAFGGNGILGVSVTQEDCGAACTVTTLHGSSNIYYTCSSSSINSCSNHSGVPLTSQLQNPVTQLAGDNNGIEIKLPSVPSSGASVVNGYLVLGINSQSNNQLSGTSYPLDSSGNLSVTYTNRNNQTNVYTGFLDSGSNALLFTDSITQCGGGITGFYCPNPSLSLSVNINGNTLPLSIASASSLFTPGKTAFYNLAGPGIGSISNEFDFGLSFFYGKNIFVGFDIASNPGPFVSF